MNTTFFLKTYISFIITCVTHTHGVVTGDGRGRREEKRLYFLPNCLEVVNNSIATRGQEFSLHSLSTVSHRGHFHKVECVRLIFLIEIRLFSHTLYPGYSFPSPHPSQVLPTSPSIQTHSLSVSPKFLRDNNHTRQSEL